MKIFAKVFLGTVALLGALVLFSQKTHRIAPADHQRYDDTFDRILGLDAGLDRDVLKARFHLLEDYDGFPAEIAALKQAVAGLGKIPAFVPEAKRRVLLAKAKEFAGPVAQKEELIEHFKSKNSVLNNSLRHLPISGVALIQQIAGSDKDRELAPLLDELMRQVLVFSLRPENRPTPEIQHSLEKVDEWRVAHAEPALNLSLSRLTAHVNSILIHKPEVDALTEQIVAVPIGAHAAEMLAIYDAEFARALHAAEVNHVLLYFLSALLLLGIGSAFYTIDSAKRNLERRVRERTHALQNEVTERQFAEHESRESQRFLQSALDALSAHIGILDEEGTIISVNVAWRHFALANGLSGDGYGVGSNYLRVCESASGDCSTEAATVAGGIREVIARRVPEFQLEYPCHSPEEKRWFVARVTRFQGDGPVRVVIAHENITARKRAEEALREKDALIRIGGRVTRTGGWVMDLLAQRLFWSDEVCDILECPRGNAPQLAEALALHPDPSRGKVTAAMEACMGNGLPFDIEVETITATGRRIWGRVCGEAERGADGAVQRVQGAFQDITERKRIEAETESLHRQLVDLSRHAGMAEVATNVLHNVGNVLNSVNVSATLLADGAKKSKVGGLARVVALLDEHAADLGAFMGHDPKGKSVPAFLRQLSAQLTLERQGALAELESLRGNIEHIKDIVSMQQNYAKVSGVTEVLQIAELIEDSLRMNAGSLTRHGVEIVREFQEVPPISVEKHKVLQILVNLIRNAKYACDDAGGLDKRMTLRVVNGGGTVKVSVADNGVGIPAENLTRIFNHGFTTRKEGHGFGLHSGALAAQEMGGALLAHSNGPGQGAVFTLELPLSLDRT